MKYMVLCESFLSLTKKTKKDISILNEMFKPLGLEFSYKRKLEGTKFKHLCRVNFDLNNLYYIHAMAQCMVDTKEIKLEFNGLGDGIKFIDIPYNHAMNKGDGIKHILDSFVSYFSRLSDTMYLNYRKTFDAINGSFFKKLVIDYVNYIIETRSTNNYENKEFLLKLIYDFIIRTPNSYSLINKIKKGSNMNALYNSLYQLNSDIEKSSELGEMGFGD